MTLKYVGLFAGLLLFSVAASAATTDRRCLKVCGDYEATFMMERNFLRETLNLSCEIKGTDDDSHDFQKSDSEVGIQFYPAQADGVCRAQISISGSTFTTVLKSVTDYGHFVLQTENPANETIVFRKLDAPSAPAEIAQAASTDAMVSGTVTGPANCSSGVVSVAVYSGQSVVQQVSVMAGSAFTLELAPGTYSISAQSTMGCVAQQQISLTQGQAGSVNLTLVPNGTYWPYGYVQYTYPGTYPF